ncbi:DUF3488 and transglutaminase-like domain-containing protein [Glycomyces halotolerans]
MSGQRHATLVAASSLALTLTPMLGVFRGLSWAVPVLLAVAVVAGAGALTRAAGRGQGLQTLAMGAGLLVLLTVVFGGGTTFLLVFPTPDTFGHWFSLALGGINDIIVMAPPVSAEGGILFLTMLGVGVVAILHDMFIVGLRTPALSGLTLLTMYLVPVSVAPEATAWFWFVLPAMAYLWVLADDNLRRVSRFGHRFTGQGRLVGPRFPSPLAGTARVAGTVFVAVTLTILAVIPTNASGLVDQVARGYGSGDGPGGGIGAVDPWAQLTGQLNRPSPIEMARITTSDPTPRYLRMHVSDLLDPDRGFGPSEYGELDSLGELEYPGGERHTATVENLELQDAVAPVYGSPTEIDLGDDWGVVPDTGVIASEDSDLGEVDSYNFDYIDPEWSAEFLEQAAAMPPDDPRRERNTDHPDIPELDERVADIIAGAETDFAKTLAILEFFSPANGFRYSLETAEADTGEKILDFLETKQGFCQQYSTAMAWMLRVADVPARVAIGLTRGTYRDGNWVVTSNDFHSWVEVHFEGAGWVPFDPTPSSGVSGSVSFPWEREPVEDADSGDPQATDRPDQPTATAGPVAEPTPIDPQNPAEEQAGAAPGDAADTGGFQPAWLALGLLVPLPFIPALWRVAVRRARLRPRRVSAVGAWDETLDLAADYDVPLSDSLTPRQAAAALAAAAPPATAAADALASAVEHHRYSGRAANATALPEAVKDLRTALGKHAETGLRLRAVLWPASLSSRFSQGRGRAAERLERVRSRVRWPRRSNTGGDGAVTGRP